jgi:hypothetical protein
LIQRLVKSNPTPEYVERVANVFNNNGSGVRGDLSAVVKAILLDQEAMECYWFGDISSGQLRPPIQRLTQLLTGLKAETQSREFYSPGLFYQEFTGQHPMSSQTVFNFYRPDYVPNSDFAYENFAGPEFQILNSSTSSNYVNFMLIGLMRDYVKERYNLNLPNVLNDPEIFPYTIDPEYYGAVLSDPLWQELGFYPEELVDYLDIVLANGNMTDESKTNIVNSILPDNLFDPMTKAHYAAFMLMINPDYVIMK